eukprot:7837250-Pyramimonas_sp.AAC.1
MHGGHRLIFTRGHTKRSLDNIDGNHCRRDVLHANQRKQISPRLATEIAPTTLEAEVGRDESRRARRG